MTKYNRKGYLFIKIFGRTGYQIEYKINEYGEYGKL